MKNTKLINSFENAINENKFPELLKNLNPKQEAIALEVNGTLHLV